MSRGKGGKKTSGMLSIGSDEIRFFFFLGLNKTVSQTFKKKIGLQSFPPVRRLSNEMLRSQAEHHAGMRFLLLLSDTCGERPAIPTSRTATYSALDVPPPRWRLPQYSASVAAPLRRWKKRRLKQMSEPRGRASPPTAHARDQSERGASHRWWDRWPTGFLLVFERANRRPILPLLLYCRFPRLAASSVASL